jgi:hypothetical protein|tara:strand:- start:1484 stop:1675 length:192 start_codon:yes stop_codon:yes gene_type:complete
MSYITSDITLTDLQKQVVQLAGTVRRLTQRVETLEKQQTSQTSQTKTQPQMNTVDEDDTCVLQ